MGYYKVWVASASYRRDEPLTYSYSDELRRGQVVIVPLQGKKTLGLVDGKVAKPSFSALEIMAVLAKSPIPKPFFELTQWLKTYYPASLGGILLSFLPSPLLIKRQPGENPEFSEPKPAKLKEAVKAPALTGEQRQAISVISDNPAESFLLHGETGSGKTRVYMELAAQAIAEGRSVLVLTPEIGLTPQLVNAFETVFGTRVVVMHSMLTARQRRDVWLRILESTYPLVVIGPRSAMFTPLKSIGLIVMDEAHESSYKQEQAPYYQTSRVAAQLARIHGAKFVMGSATPLVADYYAYANKKLPIVRLAKMAIQDAKPPLIITVRLNERVHFNSSPYISAPLIEAISDALDKKEQSLIYLNRRGSARITLCQECQWQALCPRCDVPLTYHGDTHELRCHICGHKSAAPNSCPECGNADIAFRSIGTKALFAELTRLFPGARIQRFDTDTGKHERLEKAYQGIREGKLDILVGTQLLGKGLDLPRLSVVGVVQADTSLSIPDYTADETTYQQLVQIFGRVGRGHREGKVFVQSHNPDNLAIQAAIRKDYRLFYESQLEERQRFGFPPFYYFLKLTCSRASSKSAEQASKKLRDSLASQNLPVEILGPTPSFQAKKAGKYYWQIIVKSKRRPYLTGIIGLLPAGWSYDIDPSTLL